MRLALCYHFILTDIREEGGLSKGSMFFTLWALKYTESNLGSCTDWMTPELTDVSVTVVFQRGGQLLALQEGRKPMQKSAMRQGRGFTQQVRLVVSPSLSSAMEYNSRRNTAVRKTLI